jgi:hypothetical protein
VRTVEENSRLALQKNPKPYRYDTDNTDLHGSSTFPYNFRDPDFLYHYRHPDGRERAQAFFIVRVDQRDLVFSFGLKQKVLPTYSHAGANACSLNGRQDDGVLGVPWMNTDERFKKLKNAHSIFF